MNDLFLVLDSGRASGYGLITLDVSFKDIVSQVFELGTKLGLPVAFTELKREGPLHNATFSFKVTVGDFTGVGEGRSIPLAKKLAAEKVLPDLQRGSQVECTDEMPSVKHSIIDYVPQELLPVLAAMGVLETVKESEEKNNPIRVSTSVPTATTRTCGFSYPRTRT
uniref:DRBM domain-containing protein n=1 Tax=Periophthalmus magnuspinnatus TaxID=409849 RepID=A0A3B3ZHX9_9GOBI